ncbi:MAG: hypothetical protein ACM3YO_06070 [Bacteroidota bacterium]
MKTLLTTLRNLRPIEETAKKALRLLLLVFFVLVSCNLHVCADLEEHTAPPGISASACHVAHAATGHDHTCHCPCHQFQGPRLPLEAAIALSERKISPLPPAPSSVPLSIALDPEFKPPRG